MSKIRIAIAGVGNCASSLVQGISYYGSHGRNGHADLTGLMHDRIGGFHVGDIQVVAAFDIDVRKVGRPIEQAIFAAPNNTIVFCKSIARSGVPVSMGPVLDGVASHMREFPIERRFEPSKNRPVDVAKVLCDSGAEILVNYMPVGAQKATEHYAAACLEAGVSLINCTPSFIVSDSNWAGQFKRKGIACIGDDVKSQVGATITHRTLARLFNDRGVKIDSTYQLNTAGNTDFLNMLERSRLVTKKISKTRAVQSQLDVPLDADRIHIGPADYVPFLKDNKICFLRIEGKGFGGTPVEIELRLSVEDSPNSAGVVVDAIRACKLAREKKIGGPIDPICAWTMKHPPRQLTDAQALAAFELFIAMKKQSRRRAISR